VAVNDLAKEIKASVDQLIAGSGAAGEERRLEFEAAVRGMALLQIRCHELWVQDGRQPSADFNQYLLQAGEAMYRTREQKHYRTDGTVNATEALGFLKDWGTSLVQLDTAAIGAIGLLVSES
jgi:hypothetical protein